MDLSLGFASNDTAHDDVVLRFGGGSWVCDSYEPAEMIVVRPIGGCCEAVMPHFLKTTRQHVPLETSTPGT